MATLKEMNAEEGRRRLTEAREEYWKNHAEREGVRVEEERCWIAITREAHEAGRSARYLERTRDNLIIEMEVIKKMLVGKITGPHMARARFIYIFSQLLVCPVGERINKKALTKKFNVTGRTIQQDVRLFHRFMLVKRYDGYQPTPKFFQLAEHLQQEEPGIYAILKKG